LTFTKHSQGVVMRDETLLKLSLVTGIVGIIVLFSITKMTEVQAIEIANAKEYLGKTVLMSGNITSMSISEKGTIFLKISDKTGEINAVIFKNLVSKLSGYDLKKGMQVQIQGKINKYEGELEIIPDKISII